MTGPKPVALPLGYTPKFVLIVKLLLRKVAYNLALKYTKLYSCNYIPFTGTFKKEANLLAFSSISLIFKGVSICTMGKSFFPLMQTKIVCFVLKSSVFISTLIASLK